MSANQDAADSWRRMRELHPLVHCITNYVSMDIMANTLLAAGASPAMVMDVEEIKEFAQHASVLLVNIGTLTSTNVTAMRRAAAEYQKLGKPWVLDPVAAGATQERKLAVTQLLKLGPSLIRGNASEIMAVAGMAGAGGRGVDSTATSQQALEAGRQLAARQKCIVAISGATDLVTDGKRVVRCSNGSPGMQLITATGCSLTAVMAAFLAAKPPDPVLACAHAMCIYGLAAETAGDRAGPGTLRVHMLDWLAAEQSRELSGVRFRLDEG